MSKRIVLVDDLDGTDADETIRLSLNGTEVEIDLSARNAAKVRATLQTYLDAGRRPEMAHTPPRLTTRKKANGVGPDPQIQAVRDWANANGYTVSYRGKIATHIMDAFEAAHDAEGAVTGKAKVTEVKQFSAAQ